MNPHTRKNPTLPAENKEVCQRVIRRFVSTRQAAEMLGYSRQSGSVNRLIEQGLLEAEHGPGHGLLVYVDSIEHFLQHHLDAPKRVGRPRANPEKSTRRRTA